MSKPLNAVSSAAGPPRPADRLSEGQQEQQALSVAVGLRNGRAVPGGGRAPSAPAAAAPTTRPAGGVSGGGMTGLSTTVTLAALTVPGGTTGSLTFTGGILTDVTPPT